MIPNKDAYSNTKCPRFDGHFTQQEHPPSCPLIEKASLIPIHPGDGETYCERWLLRPTEVPGSP